MNDSMVASVDADDREITALHEAGHAAFAFSSGIKVESISIQPDKGSAGRVMHAPTPRPSERDCRTGSWWMQTNVKMMLAGDRAVRRQHPLLETVGGGQTSDWYQAVRLVEAVCEGPAVEAFLDQCCIELDIFFDRPETVDLVNLICERLLDETDIDGDKFHQELFHQNCGALHPSLQLRCVNRPHPVGGHWCKVGKPWENNFVNWDGFGTGDRTPKSKHTTLQRRVLRITEPDLYPPRQTRPKINEFDGLSATANSPRATIKQRRAAARRVTRLVNDRARNGSNHLPAHTSFDASTISALDLHKTQCPKPPELDEDGYWCDRCAFQLHLSEKRPRRWLYQVSQIRAMTRPDEEALIRVAIPEAILGTAEEAETYLRLAREAHPRITYEVRRWPAPPQGRRSSPTRGAGREPIVASDENLSSIDLQKG